MLMRHTLLIAVLVLCGGMAQAQVPAKEPASELLQSCLVGTPNSTWTTLGLTRDQLVRIGRVQDACKEECTLPGVKKEDNPISNADGSTVIAEVKNILDPEQYRGWLAYCTGGTASPLTPK